MKVFAVTIGAWIAFILIFCVIYVNSTFDVMLSAIMVYLIASIALHRTNYQSVWLRNSWLARWLRRQISLVRTDVPPVIDPITGEIRQTIYAIETHGECCFGFSSLFLPSTTGRIRLLVWPKFMFIPMLRELYMLSGLVSASASSVERQLDAGFDIAVIPSGMDGLFQAVLAPNAPLITGGTDARSVDICRSSVGFCKIAVRRKLMLVPVFSAYEDAAIVKYRLLNCLPFASTLVFWTTTPVQPIIGKPLDGANYTDFNQLADDYYKALSHLADTVGYSVRIVPVNKKEK
jgi:hypothetical protein